SNKDQGIEGDQEATSSLPLDNSGAEDEIIPSAPPPPYEELENSEDRSEVTSLQEEGAVPSESYEPEIAEEEANRPIEDALTLLQEEEEVDISNEGESKEVDLNSFHEPKHESLSPKFEQKISLRVKEGVSSFGEKLQVFGSRVKAYLTSPEGIETLNKVAMFALAALLIRDLVGILGFGPLWIIGIFAMGVVASPAVRYAKTRFDNSRLIRI
ncbi:MAG: hypothetical protein WAM28_06970, partial [Chlamydiales bacterium]